eukprot:6469603-Amphidinium_carterae.1
MESQAGSGLKVTHGRHRAPTWSCGSLHVDTSKLGLKIGQGKLVASSDSPWSWVGCAQAKCVLRIRVVLSRQSSTVVRQSEVMACASVPQGSQATNIFCGFMQGLLHHRHQCQRESWTAPRTTARKPKRASPSEQCSYKSDSHA